MFAGAFILINNRPKCGGHYFPDNFFTPFPDNTPKLKQNRKTRNH